LRNPVHGQTNNVTVTGRSSRADRGDYLLGREKSSFLCRQSSDDQKPL